VGLHHGAGTGKLETPRRYLTVVAATPTSRARAAFPRHELLGKYPTPQMLDRPNKNSRNAAEA
jgi:hypothetical protein